MKKYRFSKDHYFPIPLEEIVPERKRGFPLFIYLRQNDHLMLRCKADQELRAEQIAKYIENGISQFWSPNEFKQAWLDYRSGRGPSDAQLEAVRVFEGQEEDESANFDEPASSDGARSEESALAIDVLGESSLSKSTKQKILSRLASDVMAAFVNLSSDNPAQVRESFKKCNEFVEDIVKFAAASHESRSVYEDLVLIKESEMPHSAVVSAFSALFALGLGYTETDLLADLSLAGLLHDVGLSSVSIDLTQVPETQLTQELKEKFVEHVRAGLELIRTTSLELSENARKMIAEHHERFDGKGFPEKIKGVQLGEMSQIVAFADLFDDSMSGRVDGRKRSPAQAIEWIKNRSHSPDTRAALNPEVCIRILQLIEGSRTSLENLLAHSGNRRAS